MNIRFLSIELENFRSIDRAKIDLERQGTVIVKGINEYEDNATSNGSGKSTIFEGIIYALFEETSSGEKDVENRIIQNGFSVKLDFEIDNIKYTILRQGKSGKSTVLLYKDNIDISARNKTDTNKLIVNLLGINKSIFLDSIFLSQNANTNLASLAPTARRERLEILTNTDYTINTFKEKIKQKQLQYETDRVNLQLDQNKLIGNKEVFLKQLNEYQLKINEIDEQIKKRDALGNIENINNQIEVTNQNINIQNSDMLQKDKDIEIKENEITEFRKTGENDLKLKDNLNTEINNISTEIKSIQSDIDLANYQIKQCDLEIDRQNKEIEKVKNSDTCPTCGRKYENINEDHINQVIQERETIIKNQETKKVEFNNNITELQYKLKSYYDELQNKQNDIREINNKINDFNNILNDKETCRKDLNQDKQRITNNILALNNEIQRLQNIKEQILSFKVGDKDEILKLQQDIQSKLTDIDIALDNIDHNLTDIENHINTAKHILQLITKEFRTYLLQNSLSYLNKVLEQYSQQLFSNLGDVIKICGDDAKLDIMLGNASYESLSGGERTRVNIALLLAQKSLASMIGNISCNIIILDEILGYCDSQAESKVIDLITEELDSLESIFMVSHKEIPIGYDLELVIVKDRNGLSRIKNY